MADSHDPRRDGEHVIDLDRAARPAQAPVAGAQWDEVRGVWEEWDDAAQGWVIVGDSSGTVVLPPPEAPSGEVFEQRARSTDAAPQTSDTPTVIDVDRQAEPTVAVPGAQWNEVLGRWERWDDAAGAWVEADASSRTR